MLRYVQSSSYNVLDDANTMYGIKTMACKDKIVEAFQPHLEEVFSNTFNHCPFVVKLPRVTQLLVLLILTSIRRLPLGRKKARLATKVLECSCTIVKGIFSISTGKMEELSVKKCISGLYSIKQGGRLSTLQTTFARFVPNCLYNPCYCFKACEKVLEVGCCKRITNSPPCPHKTLT